MSAVNKTLELPKNLYLETTNRCNLRCRGCILYRGNREPDRDMSLRELIRISDQLPDLKQVVLHGVGEPLLNRELPEMIAHLKNRAVHVRFNSNGILLDTARQNDLIDAGLDELHVSLDAASPRGYKKIRNSSAFDRIVTNLRSFLRVQKARRVASPRLALWFLGTKENIAELPDFIRMAADIGIGEVHLQRLVYFHDGDGYGIADGAQSLQDSADGSFKLIQISQDLAARFGIRFNASGQHTPVESFQGQPGTVLPWSGCYRPQTLMYITANGNILPCCIAPFSTMDFSSIILGNAFETPLKEIWTNANYKNFREQLQTALPPKCCRGCGVLWSL